MPYRVPGAYARFINTPSTVNNVGATRTIGIIGTGANYFEVYNETIRKSSTQAYDELAYGHAFEVISVTDRALANGEVVAGSTVYEEDKAFNLKVDADGTSKIVWATITDPKYVITAATMQGVQLRNQIEAVVNDEKGYEVIDGSYTLEVTYLEDAFDHADVSHVNCGCYRVTDNASKKIIGEWGVDEDWHTDVIPGLKIRITDVFVPDADGNSITRVGDSVTITTTAPKTEVEPEFAFDETVPNYSPALKECFTNLNEDTESNPEKYVQFMVTEGDDVVTEEWDLEVVDATTQEIQITKVSTGEVIYGPKFVGAVVEYLNVIPGITFMLPQLSSDVYTGDVVRIVTTAATYGDGIPEGSVYYVSYKYKKADEDYQPKLFYSYDDVVNEYGNYDVTASMVVINSITLGAEIAFRAGVNPVICVQARNDSDYEMKAAIDLLTADVAGINNVNTIVPLTTSVKVGAYAQEHVDKMSAESGRHERMVYLSASPGQKINKFATAADRSLGMKQRAEAYSDERVVYVVPGRVTYDVKSLQTGRVNERTLPGCYLALGVACIGLTHDPAEPLTRKKVPGGFANLLDNYTEVEKNALAESGCLVVEQKTSGLRVRHGITTKDDEVNTVEISLIQVKDYVIEQVRRTLDDLYVGIKNMPSAKANIKFSVESILSQFTAQEIILGYSGLSVKDSPTDPREVLVFFQIEAIYPLNYITISFQFASTGA